MKTEVFCSLQFEATHNWPECPFSEVDYLCDPHRHVFHVKAYKKVFHDDRDVEFIMLKHDIMDYLHAEYYDEAYRMGVLGKTSCEMLAAELIEQFDLSICEVSEDGENGAVVYNEGGLHEC